MWIFLAILAIPLIEIGLFVQFGGAIGLWATLAWVLLSGALGIILLKGVATLGAVSLSRDMHELSDPMSPLAHRVMVVLAGGLLLLPGFLTDAIGLLLLVPPIRLVVIKLIGRKLRVKATYTATRSEVIEGEWQEARPETPANSDTKPLGTTKD